MYFIALTLRIVWHQGRDALGPSDGPYVHAAIMQAISGANAALGQRLHDMPRNKPIAIAILDSSNRRALVRLTFMAEDGLATASLLCNIVPRCPNLRIGGTTCLIEGMEVGDHGAWGISTWADLQSERRARYIDMHFLTPTAFTKDGLSKRFMALLPDPKDVFGSLARRWRALEGPALPGELEHFLQSGGCVIAHHALQSISFRTSERTQVGFVGKVRYEHLLTVSPCAAAINALARLAVYSGVGYQTARGMGAVQVSLSL